MRFRESLKEFFFIRKINIRFLCKPQKITKGYKRVTICYCLLLIFGIWSEVGVAWFRVVFGAAFRCTRPSILERILTSRALVFGWFLLGFCLGFWSVFCLDFDWLFAWRSPLCYFPGGAPYLGKVSCCLPVKISVLENYKRQRSFKCAHCCLGSRICGF